MSQKKERGFHSAVEVMHYYGACGGPEECSICRPPPSMEELFRRFITESDAVVRRERRSKVLAGSTKVVT